MRLITHLQIQWRDCTRRPGEPKRRLGYLGHALTEHRHGGAKLDAGDVWQQAALKTSHPGRRQVLRHTQIFSQDGGPEWDSARGATFFQQPVRREQGPVPESGQVTAQRQAVGCAHGQER